MYEVKYLLHEPDSTETDPYVIMQYNTYLKVLDSMEDKAVIKLLLQAISTLGIDVQKLRAKIIELEYKINKDTK